MTPDFYTARNGLTATPAQIAARAKLTIYHSDLRLCPPPCPAPCSNEIVPHWVPDAAVIALMNGGAS